jgi:hypothetical protein
MPLTINPNPFEPVRSDDAKVARITASFEEEQRTHGKIYKADDLPFDYEDMTPEWFTAILGQDTPGAQVVSLDLGPKNVRRRNPMSAGSKDLSRKVPPTDVPSACNGTRLADPCRPSSSPKALKALEVRPRDSWSATELLDRINLCWGAIESEVVWYNSLRESVGIETPIGRFAAYNATSYNSIIIMDDVADSVDCCTFRTDVTKAMIASQLRLVAKLHAKFYESKDPTVLGLMSYAQGFQSLSGKTVYPSDTHDKAAPRPAILKRPRKKAGEQPRASSRPSSLRSSTARRGI